MIENKITYKLMKLDTNSSGEFLVLIVDDSGRGTCIYSNEKFRQHLGRSILGWNYSNFEEIKHDITLKLNKNNMITFFKKQNGDIIIKNKKKHSIIGRYRHGSYTISDDDSCTQLTEITFKHK